jgi:superfamily I DNA/RNA helicase
MSTNFKLSPYQQAILDYVDYTSGNLLVDAKAGSGKTSTLILIQEHLVQQNKQCLFLAFNREIVKELKEKVTNPACEFKTVHSLGNTFIRSYLWKKHKENYVLEIDENHQKLRTLVKDNYDKIAREIVDNYFEDDMDDDNLKRFHTDIISDLVTLCDRARFYNVNYHDEESLRPLAYKFTMNLSEVVDIIRYDEIIENALNKTKEMFENPEMVNNIPHYVVDFTDMIYFPVYYNMSIPFSLKNKLDTILVDEAQDLSVLQQMFLAKIDTGMNRFIFVGDKNQSIYAFSGADTNSINRIKKNFVLSELPLSICYRCPKQIIKLAQEHVPDIQWNKAREDEGVVDFVTIDEMKKNLNPNDVIVGRRNRTLVALYKQMVLKDKRPVKFRNDTMVKSLVKELETAIRDFITAYNTGANIDKEVYTYLDKVVAETGLSRNSDTYKEMKDEAVKVAHDNLKAQKRKYMKQKHTISYLETCMQDYKENGSYVYDTEEEEFMTRYYSVIEEFIEEYKKVKVSPLVRDFLEYLKEFLTANMQKDVPQISTIHGMKGGEADEVYILEYPKFPYKFRNQSEEDKQQEKNLQYVAITRAKKKLHLVYMPEDCEGGKTLNTECEMHVARLLAEKI